MATKTKKLPTWKKVVVLCNGVPIRHTRRYWLVLEAWYNGAVPDGYEVRLGDVPARNVNCLGLPEVLDQKTPKHARKNRCPMAVTQPEVQP
jgi:hypothetical protein